MPEKQYWLCIIPIEGYFFPVIDAILVAHNYKHNLIFRVDWLTSRLALSVSIAYILNLSSLIRPKQQAQGGLLGEKTVPRG